MFTGIVESVALVQDIRDENTNRIFIIESGLAPELKVDQSVAHNGVCLTVESIDLKTNQYQVTAIDETLAKTMLGDLKVGESVNLERSLQANARVDGHFVQGHVDVCGKVVEVKDQDGSFEYFISYPGDFEGLIVPKGSICLNGISLTVVENDPEKHMFSVCIIPFTIDNTNLSQLKVGVAVNLEFDILGKYVQKILNLNPAQKG